MLDVTYRTTRYALPLSFTVVKTNVDYQIVAVFVTENETEDIIQEALSIIKLWNKVKSCEFHREQAWDRWLKKIANRCSGNRLMILALLRSIACADAVNDCKKAINLLKKSTYWLENANLRQYISKYWLNIKQV